MSFSTFDLTLFIGYILFMMGFGIWLSRDTSGKEETSQDYFLASKALPWWAVGGSLIASNISTEQILGMNGSGYLMGLAIGSYELLAAATLLVVAKFFLPVFIEKGIYTMPQFLEKRYDNRVRIGLAFFWVSLFIFVNITSVLYLGGLAIQSILGVPLLMGIVGLVIYSAAFSIFGGLKAVVWTDIVQVIILVLGGFMASYMIVTTISGGGYFEGLMMLFENVPEKFDLIFEEDIFFYEKGANMGEMISHQGSETEELKSAYSLLPGIGVLIGGMWIANLYYWGNNQYIIQRALASKNLAEAQKGVAFAAFLKILMPLIVVVPGIAAYVILKDPAAYGYTGEGLGKADEAFPWVLNNFVGTGFKGIVTAALVAAIGSSVSSMVNSASTIFTLDIYKPLMNPTASESTLVRTGKITATAALLIGALIAPVLGSLEQILQFIQEYTGFVSPGVLVVFIFGIFWKRATANAALAVVVLALPLTWALKLLIPELPFLDRMGFSFLLLSTILVILSLVEHKKNATTEANDGMFRWITIISLLMISVPSGFKIAFSDTPVNTIMGYVILAISGVVIAAILTDKKVDDERAFDIDSRLFKTDMIFNVASIAVFLMLTVIYAMFW